MSEKDVQPVAKVHVHKTGGNAGVHWSAVAVNGYDSLPLLEDGTLLYLAPPAADVQELERNEQYQIQMAAISTASLGYWQEGDEISPDYDTVALRDTANLYDRYKAERADALELVEALKDLLYQAKFFEDEGGWDFEQAQAALAKWEGK
jgi:hypothetical protein